MREVPQRTLSRISAISAADLIAICSSIPATTRTTSAPDSSRASAAVAEDPRVAVLVRAELPGEAQVEQGLNEHVLARGSPGYSS